MTAFFLNPTDGEKIIHRFCREIRALHHAQRQEIRLDYTVELATEVRLLQTEANIVEYCKKQTTASILQNNQEIFIRCHSSTPETQNVDERLYHEFYQNGDFEAVATLVLAIKSRHKSVMADILAFTVPVRARLARNLHYYRFSPTQRIWLQTLRQSFRSGCSAFAITPSLQTYEERGQYYRNAPTILAWELDNPETYGKPKRPEHFLMEFSATPDRLPPVSSLLPHQIIPESLVDAYLGLHNDVKYLVMILAYLGEARIPLSMISFISEPGLTFARTGEIEISPFEAISQSPPLERSIAALRSISSLVLVTKDPREDDEMFTVQSDIREYIRATTAEAQQRQMRAEASRLVCRSFPMGEELAPYNYLGVGRAQLPHAKHILGYFEDPAFCKQFSRHECGQFIALCLSASHFSDRVWRFKVISIGVSINTYANDRLLAAKLSLREQELLRLYPQAAKPGRLQPIEHHIQATDVASNTFLGETLLFQVQCLLDKGQLTPAFLKLQKHNFKPMNRDEPSTHERGILERGKFLKAKILRFQGNFLPAAEILWNLIDTKCSQIHTGVTYHFVAVNCELGNFQNAKNIIRSEREDSRYPTWAHQTRGRRVDLAAAEISMMEALWSYREERVDDARACLLQADSSYHIFQETHQSALKSGFPYAMDVLAGSIGLAVVAHALCELSEGPEDAAWYLKTAASRWKVAWNLAERVRREFGTPVDFTEIIILSSQSDIALRDGMLALSEELRNRALSVKVGRHLLFVGVGTLWPDILEIWAKRSKE